MDNASVYLDDGERERAVEALESTKSELLDLVKDLDHEGWSHRAADDRWSAGETVEHIVLTEKAIRKMIDKALSSEGNPDFALQTDEKLRRLKPGILDRSHRATAPSYILPRSDVSRRELMERFIQARGRTLEFVRETELPVKQHASDHSIFGALNVYQWLVFIAYHQLRHHDQIREAVKAFEGFRRSGDG